MARELDDADLKQLGRLRYPACPHCGRRMVEANVGTPEREHDLLVCCDPRCKGRAKKPK